MVVCGDTSAFGQIGMCCRDVVLQGCVCGVYCHCRDVCVWSVVFAGYVCGVLYCRDVAGVVLQVGMILVF